MCQAPTFFYSEGPAQKFMMRQIRNMDEALMNPQKTTFAWVGDGPKPEKLDVCLLIMYGHILFSSSSYAYSLSRPYHPSSLNGDPVRYRADSMQ